MKKLLLLVLSIGFGNTMFAQDLSNCKKTCTKDKLVETGAFLGVRIITAEDNKYVRVTEVVPNTAAERNHFAINDIITKIDGITLMSNKHIVEIVKAHQPHDVVKIEYIHNGKTKKKRVALGALHTRVITETICCDEPVITAPKNTNNLVPADVRYTLYPNPAINNVQISADLAVTGSYEINIYDMLGNQILSKKVNESNEALNQNIDLASLANGSYIVKIMNNEKESVAKLQISK